MNYLTGGSVESKMLLIKTFAKRFFNAEEQRRKGAKNVQETYFLSKSH
jgi:hypothetical protein